MDKISEFELEGSLQKVGFVESMEVKAGVVCDIYEFFDDDTRDLALIHVEKGNKTPMQKVLNGERTIEGYISGEGILYVEDEEGKVVYKFPSDDIKFVEVKVGSTMQWTASDLSDLVFFEVCTPPYEEGRFENIKV